VADLFTADTKEAILLAKWQEAANRYEELNRQLVDQTVLSQPPLLHKLNKERTEIEDLALSFAAYHELRKQEADAEQMQHEVGLGAELQRLASEEARSLNERCREMEQRALELLDESVRIEGQRGPDIELTATMVGNRGLALLGLGRLQQARASFDEECRLAIDHSDDFTEMHCLVGESSVSIQRGELDGAQRYLDRLEGLLNKAGAPADSPPARVYALTKARLDLARGKLPEAHASFERAILEGTAPDPTNMHAYVGSSMAALAANDATNAVELARRVLNADLDLHRSPPIYCIYW